MRVLVTGSSGALGSSVAAQLSASGADVVGFDARPGRHTTVAGDLRDRHAVRLASAAVDAVVHTASLHAPHVPVRSRREFIEVNVAGTQNLLDAAAGALRVVYSSSTSVYGRALEPRGDAAVWVDETLTPQPRDVYDVTKLAAERLFELFTADTGIPTVCLRVSRFSFDDSPDLAVPYCLHRAVNVEDAARAHTLALSAALSGHETLVISGASPFRRADMPELLSRADAVLVRRDPALAALLHANGHELPRRIERVYSIDRARALLGYAPRHGVPELLQAA